MEFFTDAITAMQTLVTLLGAGLGIWGIVNLLEGYGSDNPGGKSQGMKQLMAGAGLVVVAQLLVPQLAGLFTVEAAANAGNNITFLLQYTRNYITDVIISAR